MSIFLLEPEKNFFLESFSMCVCPQQPVSLGLKYNWRFLLLEVVCWLWNGESLNLVLDIFSHNGMSSIKWIEEEPYNFFFFSICSVTEKCVDGSLCTHFKNKCFLIFPSLEKLHLASFLVILLFPTVLINTQTLLFLSFSKCKPFPVAFCCWLASLNAEHLFWLKLCLVHWPGFKRFFLSYAEQLVFWNVCVRSSVVGRDSSFWSCKSCTVFQAVL